jgi:hypothetical protein
VDFDAPTRGRCAVEPGDHDQQCGPCAADFSDLIRASSGDPVPHVLIAAGVTLKAGTVSCLSGDGPESLGFQLATSAAEWYRGAAEWDAPSVSTALFAVMARRCDGTCFDAHADLVMVHPAFAATSGFTSPAVRSTTLSRASIVLHMGAGLNTRPLRVSAASNSAAVRSSRHGGEARRCHITKHHEAYRLHVWWLEDGRVELASAEPKSVLSIPD